MADWQPRCVYCRGGEEFGPLISPCNCTGSHGYIHWDCLVGLIERYQDYPCFVCRQRYTDPRIRRYEYTPSFLQYLMSDIWRTCYGPVEVVITFIMLMLGVLMLGVLFGSLIAYYNGQGDFYLLYFLLFAGGSYVYYELLREPYNTFLANGDFPRQITRISGHPNRSFWQGPLVMDVTLTHRRIAEDAVIRANTLAYEKQQKIFRQKEMEQGILQPQPAYIPRARREAIEVRERAPDLSAYRVGRIPPHRRVRSTSAQAVSRTGSVSRTGPGGLPGPMKHPSAQFTLQRRRHSFSGKGSRLQTPVRRRTL